MASSYSAVERRQLFGQMLMSLVTHKLPSYKQILLYLSSTNSGEGNGNPLQYSCLRISWTEEMWWAIVCGVAKSGTQETNTFTFNPSFCIPLYFLETRRISLMGYKGDS